MPVVENQEQRPATFWIELAMAIERVAEELVKYYLHSASQHMDYVKRIGKFKITISVEVVDED